MRETFQFEVWNSSNFDIIFSFIEKSMKKFEILYNTIDWCYIEEHLEFFSEFLIYIPLQESGFKSKKRDSEMSHLYKTRSKKSSSTEFNENWLDSWEYIEERLEFFFRIFRPYPVPAVGLEVKKTRFHLLKHRKTFVLRREVVKMKFNNISYQYNNIM